MMPEVPLDYQYKVIEAGNVRLLMLRVNEHIEKGFRPIGGMSVIKEPLASINKFYQAVIKAT